MIGRQGLQVARGSARPVLERPGLAIEVQRHRGDVILDVAGLFLDVGAEDRRRVLHDRLHALAEPVLDAPADQHAIEQEYDGGRDHRRQREETHEAHVQSGAGIA